MDKRHLEDLLNFIKQHRSNEANFEKIHAKLEEEINAQQSDAPYSVALQEINDKQVEEYLQSKKEGSTTWPQFEKFVSEFEKLITEYIKSSS